MSLLVFITVSCLSNGGSRGQPGGIVGNVAPGKYGEGSRVKGQRLLFTFAGLNMAAVIM